MLGAANTMTSKLPKLTVLATIIFYILTLLNLRSSRWAYDGIVRAAETNRVGKGEFHP